MEESRHSEVGVAVEEIREMGGQGEKQVSAQSPDPPTLGEGEVSPHSPPPTSAMIFSSSRFSFSNSRDFSSSLLLVEDPVFMVSCASDCHSPRVINLRIWGPRFGV